jgi:Ca2+-binding RTX toxin-like protein
MLRFSNLFTAPRAPYITLGLTLGATLTATAFALSGLPSLVIGSDINDVSNALVQPQDPALAGNGIDQSLRAGDVLFGDLGPSLDDVLIGRIGVDVLLGGVGDDVLVGGTEHGHPENRDRAFGGPGNDVFLWAPGDGSDFFDGGDGIDTVALGLIGELENGQLVFRASGNQLAGDVFIDPATGRPLMSVTTSPGFCEVIDASTSASAASELAALDLTHLVRFFARNANAAFVAGTQSTDNGLRVTIHMRNVEVLVCASRAGGAIEAWNLTVSPPAPLPVASVLGRLPVLGQMIQ